MTIRFAEPNDKDQVLQLLDELVAEVNKRRVATGNAPKIESDQIARGRLYEEEILRDDVKIFVAEEDNKLIGMAEFFIVPNLRRGYYRGEIESFVVTEKIRGKGIGTKLLNAIFNFCKENNIKIIKLTSGLELVDAHKFYEHHGGKYTERMYRFEL